MLLEDHRSEVEVEHCLRHAIEIACRQAARCVELRATTSLARLLMKHTAAMKPRTMLAEIYNWVTEGFDTPDVKYANMLLDELNE